MHSVDWLINFCSLIPNITEPMVITGERSMGKEQLSIHSMKPVAATNKSAADIQSIGKTTLLMTKSVTSQPLTKPTLVNQIAQLSSTKTAATNQIAHLTTAKPLGANQIAQIANAKPAVANQIAQLGTGKSAGANQISQLTSIKATGATQIGQLTVSKSSVASQLSSKVTPSSQIVQLPSGSQASKIIGIFIAIKNIRRV